MAMLLGIHLVILIGPTVPQPAPPPLLQAVNSIEITNTDEGRDGFQINFAAGRSGPADFIDYPIVKNPLLRPFNRIIIQVFFGLTSHVLIDGVITHQQFSPSDLPRQSTLTITGEDVSFMMGRVEKIVPRPNRPDGALIREIISHSYSQYGLRPEVLDPSSESTTEVDRIPTQRGTDLEYLQALANAYNYVFYVEPTDVPGVNTAYWGPPKIVGIPQKALSVNMGVNTNVLQGINFEYNAMSPTMVRGFVLDRRTNTRIPVFTQGSTLPPLSSEPSWLSNSQNAYIKQFRADGGASWKEAQNQAQAITNSSINVVTATGELDATQYSDVLRARRLVAVRGVGFKHDGLYYVKKVVHKIKKGEYRQNFTLVREGLGSIIPGVVS